MSEDKQSNVILLPDRKECPNGKCECGCETGIVFSRGLQDILRCEKCDKYLFNASRVITGKKKRTLKTTHEAISTKQRYEIIERANGVCETCGSKNLLQVAHVISVADGHAMDIPDDVINSNENLICQCAECNSGLSGGTIPLRMYVAILFTRLKKN